MRTYVPDPGGIRAPVCVRLLRVFLWALAVCRVADATLGADDAVPAESSPVRSRGGVGLHYGIASFGEAPTHEWIAFQAYERFKGRLPAEIGTYLKDRDWAEPYTAFDDCDRTGSTMDETQGAYILEGAEEEDVYNGLEGSGYTKATWTGSGFLGLPCDASAANLFNNHFWDADESGWDTGYANALNGYAPAKCSLHKALRYWREFVLPNYPDRKSVSYYYLGRIAHLLADASVPAHVHNDGHGNFIVRGDAYEEYFGLQYAKLGRRSFGLTKASPSPPGVWSEFTSCFGP